MEEQNSAKDLSGVLGTLLSDPNQMARLTQLAGALASSGGLDALLGGVMSKNGGTPDSVTAKEESKEQPPQTSAAPSASLPTVSSAAPTDTLASALAHLNGGIGRGRPSKHEALLRALRPYLSRERQTRIDGLLRLISLASVLGGVLQATENDSASSQTV